jgi:hypothetical protein
LRAAAINRSADSRSGGNGFFYQHIDTGFDQIDTDPSVGDCGGSDDGRVDTPPQFAMVGQRQRSFGNLSGPRWVRIDDSDQLHVFRLVRDADVIPAELPGAYHRYSDFGQIPPVTFVNRHPEL